jgi:hypothetical protein
MLNSSHGCVLNIAKLECNIHILMTLGSEKLIVMLQIDVKRQYRIRLQKNESIKIVLFFQTEIHLIP